MVDNSFALLKNIPEDMFDVTITDPPYDVHCQANMSSGTAMKKQVEGGKGGGIPRVTPAFEALSGYEFIGDLLRVTKRWVAVFCTVEAFGEIKRLFSDSYVRGCIWYKPNAMGQLTGDRPACSYEGIALLHGPRKKRWNGRGSYGHWTCNSTRGKKGRHPQEKPLALCQKLVALFSEEGEKVFDPFCGSAAIGDAALSLGRDYEGWDFDTSWVDLANERLQNVVRIEQADALSLCYNGKHICIRELE
jgi:hypothetical protein